MKPYKDGENDISGTSPYPDKENGGMVPNDSIQWSGEWMDRMEGSVKGKNKGQWQVGNKSGVKSPHNNAH